MTVMADIKVGQRTVLTYFLSRIVPIATESMREREAEAGTRTTVGGVV